MTVPIYIAHEVRDVVALYPYLNEPGFRSSSVLDQLERQAQTLFTAFSAGDKRVCFQLLSWWPSASGQSSEQAADLNFSQDDARLTIAREYGFADWAAVETLASVVPDLGFEAALDLMLQGDIEALAVAIDKNPSLTKARTVYGHGSTLLHYLGANGVESHRQLVPMNACDMARLLIDRGADVRAEANMYGGGQTAYDLASTSAHPHRAGIADELLAILKGC